MSELIYQPTRVVVVATNVFIDVPTILQYEQTPLIEMAEEVKLGYTTSFTVYNSDGTKIAKVQGTRIFSTDEGKDSGLEISKYCDTTEVKLNGASIIEIQHHKGEAFRIFADLFTPNGHLVRVNKNPRPELIDASGNAIKVGGAIFSSNTIAGARIGILVNSDGNIRVGAN